MTERCNCGFGVKLSVGNSTPWIALEPFEHLSILRHGFLGLEVKDGVTLEEIQELAKLLNEKVAYVTYTGAEPIMWDTHNQ